MSSNLFTLSDGIAVEMTESEYEQESKLQKIIADNPNLLQRSSDSDDDSDPELYLIGREQTIQLFSLDHLMVDQNGVPVLVEVKRSSDPRIYREVAAQLLDYASRVSSWDVKDLKTQFEQNNPDMEPFDDSFWNTVETNLRAEHIKLVFAADKIPDSLKIIIEFLDRAMPEIEVYGVEVHQFQADEATLLATNYIGSTLIEVQKTERGTQDWDFENFVSFLEEHQFDDAVPALKSLLDSCEKIGLSAVFGHGIKHPTVSLKCGTFTICKVGVGFSKPDIEIPSRKISKKLDMDEDRIRNMFSDIPTKRDTPQYIYCDLNVMNDSSVLSDFTSPLNRIYSGVKAALQKQSLHKGKWTQDEFHNHLTQTGHESFIPVLDAMLHTAEEVGFVLSYGTGVECPTVRFKYQNRSFLEIGMDAAAYIFLSIDKISKTLGWTEAAIRAFAPSLSCRKDPQRSVLYINATEEDIPALTEMVKSLFDNIKEKSE